MTWVKLDDGFADHPKIVGLSDGAFRLHVAALCSAGRYLTDGFIVAAGVTRLVPRFKRSQVDELVTAGVWHAAEGGWMIHDFHDCNPTAEKVRGEREAARVRMNKHRSSPERSREVRLPRPDPSPTHISSTHGSNRRPPDEDEEIDIGKVLEAFAALQSKRTNVRNIPNWRHTVIENARAEHSERIRAWLAEFDVSPSRMAAALLDGVPPDWAHHRRPA